MLLNKSWDACIFICMYECMIDVCKRLCNGKRANCTCPLGRCILMRFRGMCGCAIAHACTCAHASLKGAWLQGCAAVRMCISIENYRKVYKHTYSVGEIGSLRETIIKQTLNKEKIK